MSIFGKIKDAIFGRHAEAAETGTGSPGGINSSSGPATVPGTTPATQPARPGAAPSGTSPEPQQNVTPPTPAPGAPTSAQPQASAAPAPGSASGSVDVAAILDRAAKESGQTLNWRHSVVDTMKALGLDSSLSERKELATELGYTGDQNDSATMNVWLQKALMKKLAENGGKVPADLTD